MLKRQIDLRDTKERRKAIRKHAFVDTIFDCFWWHIGWIVFLVLAQTALYYLGFYSWLDILITGKDTFQHDSIVISTSIAYFVFGIYDFIQTYKDNIRKFEIVYANFVRPSLSFEQKFKEDLERVRDILEKL